MNPVTITAITAAGLAVLLAVSGLRIIKEHERGLVLRLGRRGALLSPGLRMVLPLGIDRVVRVDMRSTVLRLPRQEVITADGVPLQASASMHLQVVNPVLAVTRVVDGRASATDVAQAALREAASRTSLHTMLTDLAGFRAATARFVDERTPAWGLSVTAIDLIDIDLPDAMRQAMAQALERAAAPPGVPVSVASGAQAPQRAAEATPALEQFVDVPGRASSSSHVSPAAANPSASG